MQKFLIAAFLCLSNPLFADDPRVIAALNIHILPRMSHLADTSQTFANSVQTSCGSESIDDFFAVFDAWVEVSHLRFGPSEKEDRAFAISFWPDSKGFTAKALKNLIAAEDDSVSNAAEFAENSIAGRGLYAFEYLLFDPELSLQGSAKYRCELQIAIANDIAENALSIHKDWQSYQSFLRVPSPNGIYRNDGEAKREIFKALLTGLQFTSEVRLGRPLGTFEKPRPKRAEARRSQRSLRHVQLSLRSLEELSLILANDSEKLKEALALAFKNAIKTTDALDDVAFSKVNDPTGRLKVEILQQSIEQIRELVAVELGPHLGVAAGFNALDGD